ncbi:phosphatidylglycerophosphatase A [bacterium]|nr:MAG: phosphatidylglycerophosphatase A [bacterium]
MTRIFATGLGAGYSPFAPGTVGTLVAIPLFVILSNWGSTGVLIGLVIITLMGIPLASRMEELTATKDPGRVVIDEIAGYLVAMLGSPPDLIHILAGFLLFRFFDILKPPPIRYLERAFFSGLGVMADDLMAGAYAWGVLRLLERFFM